jgi:CRISPR/Cas system endoribonuclease Cas6 (RAMP superfamily)
MTKVKTLILKFENEIERYEISFFRGAVIAAVGKEEDVLFHNHEGDNYRYSYPLIQYKRIHGCAAIVCVNEGTETIGDFFSSCNFEFNIGGRKIEMVISSVKAYQTEVQIWNTQFSYSIRSWLPLNSENYHKYIAIDGLAEKTEFLENILRGNILSFLKGVDIHIDDDLQCTITQLSEPRTVKNKNVKLMCFDAQFKSNVSLPDFIGLGKNASIGYGMITTIKI